MHQLSPHQSWYYLYALYVDYSISNQFYNKEEEIARIKHILSSVQELLELKAPYRKSWQLRLFTEREKITRFTEIMRNGPSAYVKQILNNSPNNNYTRKPPAKLKTV